MSLISVLVNGDLRRGRDSFGVNATVSPIVNGENWITFIYPVGKHGGVAFQTYKFNDLPNNLVVAGEDSRSAHDFMKQIIDTYVRSM